jgi:hypothetical protein
VRNEEFAMFLPSTSEQASSPVFLACWWPIVFPECAKIAPKIGWGTARFDSMG